MKITKTVSLFVLNTLLSAGVATAQLALTGTSYNQNFDGIGSDLPEGWTVRTNASASSLGTMTTYAAEPTNWANLNGQFANYASTVSGEGTNFIGDESNAIQNNCPNRCLGVRQTGSFGDPGAAFVLQLQNTLGLDGFQLSVNLNLLRVQSRTNCWVIDYGVGANPTEFIAVCTNADTGVFGATIKTVSFGAALDNRAENVWIRIVARSATAGSGYRDTFGIDNFNLSYNASGTITPIPLGIRHEGNNVVLTWANPSFVLQSAPTVDGVFTNEPGATSPCTNTITAQQKYFRLKAN